MKALYNAANLFLAVLITSSTSFAEDWSKKVSSRLDQLEIGAHEIDITTEGSDVRISGWVGSAEDHQKIVTAVREMEGVGKLTDEIDVNSQVLLDDSSVLAARMAEVKAAAEKYMSGIKPRGGYKFQFEIDEDGVLIKGSVPPGVEPRALLYNIRREVSTPVREEIFVRPWPADNELAERVKTDLKDRQGLSLQGIEVSVVNGTVTLKGHRISHEEVDRLAAAVLMVEGVRELKSEIVYPDSFRP